MNGAVLDIAQRLYEATIRRHLPRVLGVYNGVITRKYYLLDLQGRTHEPDYKRTLVERALAAVEPGDTVVEIGGGYGVCTVRAASAVGADGRVVSYEANGEQLATIREALELTGEVRGERLRDRVDLRHAVVGADVNIYGPMAGAGRIDVSELPSCDVLLMDCEGAERDIVRGMECEPRTVVVESHPQQGSPTDDLGEILASRGYAFDAARVATTDAGPKDIVTATRGDR